MSMTGVFLGRWHYVHRSVHDLRCRPCLRSCGRLRSCRCWSCDVLKRDCPGARLLLRSDNADRKPAGCPIQLKSPHAGPAALIGCGYVRAKPIHECAAWPILRKMKANHGASHRPPRFIRNFHRQRAGAPCAEGIHSAFTFDDLNLQNCDLSRRRAGKRYNQRRRGPTGSHLLITFVARCRGACPLRLPSAPKRQ